MAEQQLYLLMMHDDPYSSVEGVFTTSERADDYQRYLEQTPGHEGNCTFTVKRARLDPAVPDRPWWWEDQAPAEGAPAAEEATPPKPRSTYRRILDGIAAIDGEVPDGPWHLIANIGERRRQEANLEAPRECFVCGEVIRAQHPAYYELIGETDRWRRATMHQRCARLLKQRRCPDLDLINH